MNFFEIMKDSAACEFDPLWEQHGSCLCFNGRLLCWKAHDNLTLTYDTGQYEYEVDLEHHDCLHEYLHRLRLKVWAKDDPNFLNDFALAFLYMHALRSTKFKLFNPKGWGVNKVIRDAETSRSLRNEISKSLGCDE